MKQMTAGLFDLTIILLIAAGLGIIARLLKQPIILAYIFAGVIAALFGFFHITDRELFNTFSDIGIMFLLFLIGLEIDYNSLRLVGRSSLIVGISQIVFTFAIGFVLALVFGFGHLHSAYIAIALTFSSTIIVVKLLSEKRDSGSLYGKISIGVLLMQDFAAIILLIFLAGTETGNGPVFKEIILTIIKGVILFGAMVWVGRKLLPHLFNKIARSQELLFLTSLAWCFGIATIAAKIGFSIEIGGFLAGLTLANSSEHFQISAKIKSLRDFFVLIFFALLGSSLVFSNLSGIILPVIVFSLFVLIGNPIIIFIIMGVLGYKRRTSFMCGITLAQISEFSLILAAFGLKIGQLDEKSVSLITAVGIITILLSGYMITYSEWLYKRFSKFVFERKTHVQNEAMDSGFHKPIILIGAHRVGRNIASHLIKDDLLIVDFDPDVVMHMKKQGYAVLFGDVADEEIMEKTNLKSSRLIISTSPDFDDNLRILNEAKGVKKNKPKVILRAESEKDAKIFYENGADYVIIPHLTSGQYIGKTIAVDKELKILEQLKKRDLKLI